MGRLIYTLSGNGDSITLNNSTPQDFFKAAGASGLGVAPTKIITRESSGDGVKVRGSKRLARFIDMPIHIFGVDADDIETKQRRVTRLLNDDFDTPKLTAMYPDGSEWEIEVHYAGGADLVWGSPDTDGKTYATWLLSLMAPDPYFTSLTPVAMPTVKSANSGRGLIRTGGGGLSRLRISSSQTIGTVQVNNPGDVDAYPIWVVKGPGDSFTATRTIDGASMEYGEALLTNTITIDTRAKTVKDQLGDNRFGDMVGAPKLFSIPQGESTVSILIPNATADTRVDMSFYPRKELVFG